MKDRQKRIKNQAVATKKTGLVNLPKAITPINTSGKLASIADVSEKTYRMGAKILQSDDEQLKQEVLSGQKSISAGYKELSRGTDEPNSAPLRNIANFVRLKVPMWRVWSKTEKVSIR